VVCPVGMAGMRPGRHGPRHGLRAWWAPLGRHGARQGLRASGPRGLRGARAWPQGLGHGPQGFVGARWRTGAVLGRHGLGMAPSWASWALLGSVAPSWASWALGGAVLGSVALGHGLGASASRRGAVLGRHGPWRVLVPAWADRAWPLARSWCRHGPIGHGPWRAPGAGMASGPRGLRGARAWPQGLGGFVALGHGPWAILVPSWAILVPRECPSCALAPRDRPRTGGFLGVAP